MPSVAVIDIGSNSIKVLVASRIAGERLTARMMRTIEARISAGIGQNPPRLAPESMARGVEAVRDLVAEAMAFQPEQTEVVATSAVRDAVNGPEFCRQVEDTTGQAVRVLSGEEEANLIGRGLLCDPLLGELRDFYLFDLGGGSLECLSFRDRRIEQAASLPLGCVRLTEKFVADPSLPFAPETGAAIAAHVRDTVTAARFSLAAPAPVIGSGGTLTCVRSVVAARASLPPEEAAPSLTVVQLRDMQIRLGALPLVDRKKVAGLPPARADVFPTALAILVALGEIGGFDAYQYSSYNLRWGVAAEALDKGI